MAGTDDVFGIAMDTGEQMWSAPREEGFDDLQTLVRVGQDDWLDSAGGRLQVLDIKRGTVRRLLSDIAGFEDAFLGSDGLYVLAGAAPYQLRVIDPFSEREAWRFETEFPFTFNAHVIESGGVVVMVLNDEVVALGW